MGRQQRDRARLASLLASDLAIRDQSEVISDGDQWRRWESNRRQTTLFRMIR
jgi:hypothetical protein